MKIFEQIEAKYGMVLPDAYRVMAESGWFDVTRNDQYLWLYESEWLAPVDILHYEPQEYHKPGFVPFAHTGGGDHWCWWPEKGVIVLCPHDFELGEYDSPTFESFLYRRCLHYAHGGFIREEETETRELLVQWAERLAVFFPPHWVVQLKDLAKARLKEWNHCGFLEYGLLGLREYQTILERELNFPQLNQRFQWMIPFSIE